MAARRNKINYSSMMMGGKVSLWQKILQQLIQNIFNLKMLMVLYIIINFSLK